MRTLHRDFFAVAVLAVVVLINQFYLVPKEVLAHGTSSTYPQMLNGLLAVFTVCYFVEALRQRKRGADGKALIQVNIAAMAKPVSLLACIWLWVEGAHYAGFLVPTALLLVSASLLYGERSPGKIAALSLIAPLAIFLFFAALNSALPDGPLDIWLLTMLKG